MTKSCTRVSIRWHITCLRWHVDHTDEDATFPDAMNDTGESLVIGADGLLGRAISEHLHRLGQRVVETRRRSHLASPPLDITTMAESWQPPHNVKTAYFCAAVTSQAECRASFDHAYAVNVKGTVSLIRRFVDAGIFVVFPSTNLVFDGSRPLVPHGAATCPTTAYGRMKAEAEARLLAFGEGVGIVRLTKVVHTGLPLFTQWRTDLVSGLPVRPFHDMVFSPLPLTEAVSILIAVAHARVHGIIQASTQDDISYAEACCLLAERLTIPMSRVQPMSWRDSGHIFEHVPSHTTLDTSAATELCGFQPPQARAVLSQIAGSLTATEAVPRTCGTTFL